MNGYSRIFRGGFDDCGHFIGGEFHADDCDCGQCEPTQQWSVWHSDRIRDFDAMVSDMRHCVGMSLKQAKQELENSKIGDVFLDCIRIS